MRTITALGFASALLLLAAVAVELGWGGWFRSDPLDRLGVPRDSALTVSSAPLYPGGGDFVYRRDHWGFRGPGLDPAGYSIVTLGGTTTTQIHLPEDRTWQAAMERELAALSREDVGVANAGMDAQRPVAPLRALRDWLPRVPGLAPHFVLFLVGADDLGEGDGVAPPGPLDWLRERSALWRWAASLHSPPERLAAGIPASHGGGTGAAKAHLKAVARAIHGLGAVPVLLTQPMDAAFERAALLAGINQAARDVCRDEGLLCLDAAREVAFESGDFYDYLHNTPAGAEKMGRWLASKLAGLV